MAKSGITLEFDWTPNIVFVVDAFVALSGAVERMDDPLRKAVAVISQSIATNFDVGGRPAWSPLAPQTEARKQGGGILVETGTLKSEASSEGAWTIHSDYAEMNDATEYGNFHQEGTRFMPARPWAVIQDEDQDAIVKVFDDWVGSLL